MLESFKKKINPDRFFSKKDRRTLLIDVLVNIPQNF